MSRDDTVYLLHMIETARKAATKASGVTAPEFLADENLHLAVTHLLQVVGEAASRVSPETRSRHPAIPWKGVIGLRHRVVHDYLDVDLDIVWKVATEDLRPLIVALEHLVAGESQA